MRIITGEFKGRKLLPPEGETTRPITDRVKTALFSILSGWMGGSVVLDLFAGTGSLGLEALSRGARLVCFAERDPSALDRLRGNIEALGIGDRCRVWPGDILTGLAARLAELGETVDVAFVDPPYALFGGHDTGQASPVRRQAPPTPATGAAARTPVSCPPKSWADASERLFAPLAARLADDGVVAFRCPRNMPLPEAFGPLCVRARRDYGTMSLVLLTAQDVRPADGPPPSGGG